MVTDKQHEAFVSLRTVWPTERIVLIGAGALHAQRRVVRFTADLDVAVAIDLAHYPGGLLANPDWHHDPKQAQRWVHRNGVLLDVIPAGDAARAQGYVLLSKSRRLSLEGFEGLFSRPLPFLDASLRIELATVPLVVLLKMVAWLDRPAERARDLQDLAFLLSDYLDESNDADFDRILGAVQQGHVAHHTAHAFLLGKDVAACEGAAPITQRFIASLAGTHRWMLGDMQRSGPATLSRDAAFDAVWGSFLLGLGLSA